LSLKNLSESKLFELLSVMNTREWKALGKTEVVSGKEHMVKLYRYLDSYYPDFKAITTNRRIVFESVFDKDSYDDKKLRYLFASMLSAAEAVLIRSALNAEPATGTRLLASELARRGAGKNYLSLYHKDANSGRGDASATPERYFADFRREEIHLLHYQPHRTRGETNIGQTARSLDLFYVVKKLQLLCEMANARNVVAVDHEKMLSDEIIGALQKGAYAEVPSVKAWYRVWRTLNEPEEEIHFLALRDTLSESKHEFPQQELRDLYQYLMNFCIRKINTGNTAYVHTLLALYKLLLTEGILFDNGTISQWDYKNITAIGIRAGEHEWTGMFLEHYKLKLPKADRSNAYLYNRAYYLFNTGQRSQALTLLQQVEFNDLYYQLDSRVILLKCYFENGDEDAFFYHASAFRLFLARNRKVSVYQRTVYSNLIKYTTRLLRVAGESKKVDALRSEVEQVRNVADIGWLLKQMVVGSR
jgi:hypothetical protein